MDGVMLRYWFAFLTRAFVSMMLAAALVVGASCNGTGSTSDGSAGSTGGSGGHVGGAGGHGTGGQGGNDNLCLSAGQSCGTGPICCSGLTCCQGNGGQASCVVGGCTPAGGRGGNSGAGGGAGGAGGSSAAGGAGGGGGAQACLTDGMPCASANQCCSFICAGACQSMVVSDRNMKRDFASVNDDEVLKAVDALPITSWSYKGDGTNARHIGPMAQDFMSTFHVGSNDRTILQVDGDGISLAAIKALSQRVKDLEARNRALENQVSVLRGRLPRSHRRDEDHHP
jgi:Chaperone of endosialidase